MSRIEFPKWTGELGWEVMSWVPMCRKKAAEYDEVVCSSFEGMEPLYYDFVTEFKPHTGASRSLDYPKQYRVKGRYYPYGDALPNFDILIHARGTRRKANINYHRWPELARLLKSYRIAFIGTRDDLHVPGQPDLRGVHLSKLMDYLAGAKLTVGVSSGVMHLAAACRCNLVVWGDCRTYFSETLEQRYKVTWNPFKVKVNWINTDDWQPDPHEIFETIKEIMK